ncbi:MAG: peptide ABC transporter ATP-binding protein [Chloroflexus sp.]|uniref:DMT family transporter n=1 Tax=Chloroflexus sp. TaxID=1904827 RepID=UPI0021DC3FBC|nr:DMT family transporter [Chloroflexus sp.]GIV91068.1 MAG: peptide ABC transporter ATP-binding protein [Chloroflexus sp.]GIV91075.1 MAG: peptide ABC transporter ATP-binding protein [Chloroflexus sp.]
MKNQTTSTVHLTTIAPLLFVMLWSTGFIGARFGLPYIEPFTFLSIRFGLVLLLLGMLTIVLRQPWLSQPSAYGHSAVVGILLHSGYLGGVFFAIDSGMPAGLTALIVSLQPILTALISQWTLGEHISWRQWLGLGLGLVGVAAVIGDKLMVAGPPMITPVTLGSAIIALLATTTGTLYQKRFGTGLPLLSGTWAQYVGALAVTGPLALLIETRTIEWRAELIGALLWLTLVLSIGAILLLMFLIRARSAARVSSLFYLVPPATALEAWILFGERLGLWAFGGLIVASIGVALVVTTSPTTQSR